MISKQLDDVSAPLNQCYVPGREVTVSLDVDVGTAPKPAGCMQSANFTPLPTQTEGDDSQEFNHVREIGRRRMHQCCHTADILCVNEGTLHQKGYSDTPVSVSVLRRFH
eukprot:COSAG01_NODE_233_length_20982_cov_14.774458_12_plen_109_part_00